jgi:putative ABC transport system substrate-binding protein
MDRRYAVAALLAVPLLARAAMAANAKHVKRVGYVSYNLPQEALAANPRAFVAPPLLIDGLRHLGWREGENIEFVWRSAEGQAERHGAIFDELIAMPVDVLVIYGNWEDAASRTRTIPIVIHSSGSAEHLRSERSKNFPVNLTGVLARYPETHGKALSLLNATVPKARRVAVAFGGRPTDAALYPSLTEPARSLGLSLIPAPYDLDAPVAGLQRGRDAGAEGFYFVPAVHVPSRHRLVEAWLTRHRIPAIYGSVETAEAGGLMAYGPNLQLLYRRLPFFVDRILRGARPEDLPLEQPAALQLVVNLRAARAIGLVVPPDVLLQADRVIG